MITRVKKVVERKHALIQDALTLYKSPTFSGAKPIEVDLLGHKWLILDVQEDNSFVTFSKTWPTTNFYTYSKVTVILAIYFPLSTTTQL